MSLPKVQVDNNDTPLILGIEGTAHTLGVGIIEGTKILADERATYIPEEGGIHPRESARNMAKNIPQTIRKSLEKANIDFKDLDAIAFSQGPGLGPCLRTVATAARTLSILSGNKPLLGVNHCIAHVELGRIVTGARDPITLYVSGGNTQIISYNRGFYRIYGETLDLAVGNALDMLARELGLPHPGGPKIEQLARQWESKKLLPLPYIVKGMSLSFSGLLTSAKKMIKKGEDPRQLAYSFQEVAFAMLAEVTERAIACTPSKSEVMLTGGVAANTRLNEMIAAVAKEHDRTFYPVPKKLAGDNGVMIAMAGLQEYKIGRFLNIEASVVKPKWRVDNVPIPWMRDRE